MAFSGWVDGAGDLFLVSPTRWVVVVVVDQLSWMYWILDFYLFIYFS